MSDDAARSTGTRSEPDDAPRSRQDGAPGAKVDIDAAIDIVAREMTNIEAPASLRANILARIETGRAHPGWFAIPGLAVPRFAASRWAWAAGVSVVAVGLFVTLWPVRPPQQPESVWTRQNAAPGAGGTARATAIAPDATLAAAGMPGAAPDGNRAAAPGTVQASNANAGDADAQAGAELEPGPAPLAAPQPIVVANLGPGVIEIAGIQVAPLNQIQPLAIRDIALGSTDPQRRQDR